MTHSGFPCVERGFHRDPSDQRVVRVCTQGFGTRAAGLRDTKYDPGAMWLDQREWTNITPTTVGTRQIAKLSRSINQEIGVGTCMYVCTYIHTYMYMYHLSNRTQISDTRLHHHLSHKP